MMEEKEISEARESYAAGNRAPWVLTRLAAAYHQQRGPMKDLLDAARFLRDELNRLAPTIIRSPGFRCLDAAIKEVDRA